MPEHVPITLLNVDDYAPGLYARSRTLRQAGFNVLDAGSGAEALRLAAIHRPALALLDVNMPDMNGLEVCRRLKTDADTAAVLVLHISATATRGSDRLQALEYGADLYLIEPVEPEELVATVRALLRLRETETALRERDRQLQAILEHTPVILFMKTADGRYLLVNREYERLADRPVAELRGRRDVDLFDRAVASFLGAHEQEALLNRQPIEFEAPLGLGAADRVYHQLKFPVYDAAGRAYAICTIATDITQRKLAEGEYQALLTREQTARREAESANRAKDDFLATLSHELRTPISAILGWTQVLTTGQRDEETLRRALESIERNSRQQVQLIDDLLDLSRIVAGKLRLDLRVVDLGPVLQAALDTVQPAAQAKEIQITSHLDPGASVVMGDPDRLQQIFWNLLSNAVKFTPRGGRVEVRLEEVDSWAKIHVIDNGAGIAGELLPRIFDRFRQADATTSRVHGGLGLGLAIVRHLVELQGGTVSASSPGPDRGSTFTVMLPLVPIRITKAQAETPLDLRQYDGPRCDGLRVLVVDDEADGREVVARFLKSAGATVVVAESVGDALATVDRDAFHAIVSDLAMPGEDGLALVRAIRGRGIGTPLIALTAHASAQMRVRALMAGFNTYVTKPVEPAELAAVIVQQAGRAQVPAD
jgi:signal transduction histidine kinase